MRTVSYARAAGLLYLLIITFGLSSELLIRNELIIPDDAMLTAANILASSPLFRAGFALDTVMLFADVAIAVLFYLLFRHVSKTLALTAMAFRLVQATVLACALLFYFTALLVLKESAFEGTDAHALAALFLQMHAHGYDLALLFFAISNAILGYMITLSASGPEILGYGLIAASLVYLAGGFTHFLLPEYLPLLQPAYLIPFVAELAFALWLLAKGGNIIEPKSAQNPGQ